MLRPRSLATGLRPSALLVLLAVVACLLAIPKPAAVNLVSILLARTVAEAPSSQNPDALRALRLIPRLSESKRDLASAVVLAGLDQPKAAAAAFQEAIANVPNDLRRRVLATSLLLRAGDGADAAAMWKGVPSAADSLIGWGNALSATGQLPLARQYFQLARDTDPTNATAACQLGGSDQELGLPGAQSLLEEGLALDPEGETNPREIAICYWRLGLFQLWASNPSSAAVTFLKGLSIYETYDLQLGITYAFMAQGEPGLAEPHLLRARTLAPWYEAVWLTGGQLYASEGNPEESCRWFRRALSLSPGDGSALAGLTQSCEAPLVIRKPADA